MNRPEKHFLSQIVTTLWNFSFEAYFEHHFGVFVDRLGEHTAKSGEDIYMDIGG